MPQPNWDERYALGEAPWDTGEPCECLTELVEAKRVRPGRVIDIGCGTGTNASWLAARGFDVVGVDISGRAIATAKARLGGATGRCRFEQLDFLRDRLPEGPFDLAYDRGVFHGFDDPDDRSRFAERVASLLSAGGRWASLCGSTEGPPRDHGPPRRSVRDIAEAVEPWLAIEELRRAEFTANIPSPAAGWWFIARVRDVPAQPSTQ